LGRSRSPWAEVGKHADATADLVVMPNEGSATAPFLRKLAVVESWQVFVISGHDKHDCGAESDYEINDEAQRANVQQVPNSWPNKSADQYKDERHCQYIHHELRYVPKRCRPLFHRYRRLARHSADSSVGRSDAALIWPCLRSNESSRKFDLVPWTATYVHIRFDPCPV